jgi:hypothetical protein
MQEIKQEFRLFEEPEHYAMFYIKSVPLFSNLRVDFLHPRGTEEVHEVRARAMGMAGCMETVDEKATALEEDGITVNSKLIRVIVDDNGGQSLWCESTAQKLEYCPDTLSILEHLNTN